MPYDKDTESHFKYGLGFYICPGLEPYFYGTKHISNRIAVIHFRFYTQKGRKLQITIISVYAPTSQATRNIQFIFSKKSLRHHRRGSKLKTRDKSQRHRGLHGLSRQRNQKSKRSFTSNIPPEQPALRN